MTILIAGSRGFLGKEIVSQLGNETEYFTLDRAERRHVFSISDREGKQICVGGPRTVATALSQLHLETAINATGSVAKGYGYRDIDVLVDANILFPTILASMLVESRVGRLVHVSTFSKSSDGRTYSPQTLYAATKQAMDDLLIFFSTQRSLEVISLEPYDIYGKNQGHGRIFDLFANALIGDTPITLNGDGNQEVCPLHVSDAAAATLHALSHNIDDVGPFVTYSVLGPSIVSVAELAKVISRVLDREWKENQLSFGGISSAPIIPRVNPLAQKLPGWVPKVTLEHGLAMSYSNQ